MPDLRVVVVMDYQNVHLTAHGLFAVSRHLPWHESLVDPVHFGIQLIAARNRAQRPEMDHAVLVYRGQPSAEHDPKPYARNQAQKAHWERDGRVSVTHRPLSTATSATPPASCCSVSTGRGSLGSAKIETFSWCDPAQRHRIRQLRPGSGRTIWNTRLGETEFRNCWDLTKYP